MVDDAPILIEKVTALITCEHNGKAYLLLFHHPFAGIQIPAGTVEAGEAPAVAARREAYEETGLTELSEGRLLEVREEVLPVGLQLMVVTTPVYARPDKTSAAWATLRNGLAVRIERERAGFTQVTYEEFEQNDNSQFVSYCITGWVPTHTLAQKRLRHFFHFETTADPSQRWEVITDNHRFGLFWAPLADLPPINPHQAAWPALLRPLFPNL